MNIMTCILFVTVILLCDKFQWSETLDNSELEDSSWNFVNPNGVEGSLSYTEDISNSSSSGIVKTCKAFLEYFAKESSLFTRCLVENARPFRFCVTCVTYYERASTVYTDLVSMGLWMLLQPQSVIFQLHHDILYPTHMHLYADIQSWVDGVFFEFQGVKTLCTNYISHLLLHVKILVK